MDNEIIQNVLKLVQGALEDLENDSKKLSNIIKRCIRISRLRNDFDNLLWLEYELIDISDDEKKKDILIELSPHYSRSDLEKLYKKNGERIINERSVKSFNERAGTLIDEGKICKYTVPELENVIESFTDQIKDGGPPKGLHPVDLYFMEKESQKNKGLLTLMKAEYFSVLEKIKTRVYDFLSMTEKQLIFKQMHSDVFEKNRLYVESQLDTIAPEAISQFASAYKRLNENDAEARSQALLSCRRILKTIADRLYPSKPEAVTGYDGKDRILNDEKYISRLIQYVYEKSKSSSSKLLIAQLNDLSSRLETLNDLSSKGVHSDVSEFEVNQCFIQTYLLIGDILRFTKDISIDKDSDIIKIVKED